MAESAATSAPSRVIHCPHCPHHILERVVNGGHPFGLCSRCGGLWFLTATSREALKESIHFQEVGESRIDCPRCRVSLKALRVKELPDLEIDECPKCRGIWLDHGEWDHLIALQTVKDHLDERDRDTTWGEWFFQFLLRLPIEFNIKPHRPPVVTISIISVCTLVFFGMLALASDGGVQFVKTYGLQPVLLSTSAGLTALITHMFLHGGVFHLLGNMYFLYILGDNLEDVMGRFRFLGFYLACGVAGSLLFCSLAPESSRPLVGASGAISGVMGGYVLLFPHARLTFLILFKQFKLPVVGWVGIWIAVQLFFFGLDPTSAQSPVAYTAHLGGFVAGLLVVLPFRERIVTRNPLLRILVSQLGPTDPRVAGKGRAPAS